MLRKYHVTHVRAVTCTAELSQCLYHHPERPPPCLKVRSAASTLLHCALIGLRSFTWLITLLLAAPLCWQRSTQTIPSAHPFALRCRQLQYCSQAHSFTPSHMCSHLC